MARGSEEQEAAHAEPGRRGGPRPGSLAPSALGFAAGAGLYFLQPQPAPALAIALLLGLAGAGLLSRRMPWALAAVGLGFCWAHLWACALLCNPFPQELAGEDVRAVGRIASLPDRNARRTRFLFRITALESEAGAVGFGGLVRLSWYRDAPALAAGERWRLRLRLKPPHGFVNPGGFDYERWLFRQQVAATGYVRDAGVAERLAAGAGPYWLDRWRQGLRARLHAALPAGVGRALIPALVIGERGGLGPAQWQVFSRTGTSHLIAISGLHVGLVAGAVFLLVRRLWARLPALALRLAAPRAGAAAGLLAALGYAALAGFAVSTQRALVMLAVVLGALIAGRTLRPAAALVLALGAVLLADPAAVLDYGFWLSFGAVALLLYALGQRLGPPGMVARWGAAQWAVAVGLFPLLILFFGSASLVAPLINLIALPLFGVLLPLVLSAAVMTLASGWALPLVLAAWPLEQGYALLERVADAPWAAATLGGRPDWAWGAALLGVVLVLAPRGLPGRWLGAVMLLPLWLAEPRGPPRGALDLALLDVGQGLAAVLRTAEHAVVYDVGPRFPSGFNTADAVVLPYLRQAGIDRLDLLILSHADQDHAGGVRELVDALPVARVLSGEPGELVEVGAQPCRRGQNWRWDDVRFRVLHPSDGSESGNDSSCVLRVTAGGASLLLTGDIGAPVERALAQREGRALSSRVLVAGHHGSASSSTAVFVDAVQPEWVLFSAGWMNRWGFPAEAVRDRILARGARTLNTATSGAIELRLGPGAEVAISGLGRTRAARLWRHRPAAAGAAAAPPAVRD